MFEMVITDQLTIFIVCDSDIDNSLGENCCSELCFSDDVER
jgi:hypothetical protein